MSNLALPEFVVLTGAGFSKPFGLPLANELNIYLYNDPNVRKNKNLVDLIKKNNNFENAYSILQKNNDQDFESYSKAVQDRFSIMNEHCESTAPKLQIKDNLVKHFIEAYFKGKNNDSSLHFFTLNQDLLLECIFPYREGLRHGIDLIYPGICTIVGQDIADYSYSPKVVSTPCRFRHDISTIDIDKSNDFDKTFLDQTKQSANVIDNQPVYKVYYFKLHGSSNWYTEDGNLMIIGDNKISQYKNNNLLNLYIRNFEERIKNNNLVIIGYSFNDDHINDVIWDAVSNFNTKVYYISPDANLNKNHDSKIRQDLIYNMFPYRLEQLLDFYEAQLTFEMKEVRRALNFE